MTGRRWRVSARTRPWSRTLTRWCGIRRGRRQSSVCGRPRGALWRRRQSAVQAAAGMRRGQGTAGQPTAEVEWTHPLSSSCRPFVHSAALSVAPPRCLPSVAPPSTGHCMLRRPLREARLLVEGSSLHSSCETGQHCRHATPFAMLRHSPRNVPRRAVSPAALPWRGRGLPEHQISTAGA